MVSTPAAEILTRLQGALERSPVARYLRESRASVAELISRSRALSDSEIAGLEARGNRCDDWTAVRVADVKGLVGAASFDEIRQCRFEGSVILRFVASGASPVLSNSRFQDVILGTVVVENCARVRRAFLEDGAYLFNVGDLSGFKNSRFSLGTFLQPGDETGSRKVFLLDGLHVSDCAAMAALKPAEQIEVETDLKKRMMDLESDYAYVGAKARIEHAVLIENCFIGPGCAVRGAVTLMNSIFASTLESPAHLSENIFVSDSVLDAGVGVHQGAQVRRSLLLEFSAAGHAGQVADSVLGPNTIMGKGEITASLVGPFTGFHHQSLLIGTLWPEGRGNVAYGANVGSNHTGRKPDQELRAGEGIFFGLGCSIKFPANYEASPYSLFASGVIAAPQKIEFPFSLVTTSSESLAPGLNEIAPGWMWGENAYALIRNAYKYADRNRAVRHSVPERPAPEGNALAGTFLASDLFAPRIAQWVLTALSRFPRVEPVKVAGVYVEKDVAGLGKNFMRGPALKRARAAYRDYLAFYLMRQALWNPGVSLAHSETGRPLLKALDLDSERRLDVEGLFRDFAASVEASLAKDTERGGKVFEDYAAFHPSPEADPVCARLRGDLQRLHTAWQVVVGT